jgi:hypothetical protein
MDGNGAWFQMGGIAGSSMDTDYKLRIHYALASNSTILNITVNGVSAGNATIVSTGNWQIYTGVAELRIPPELMTPGKTNTIRITKTSGAGGNFCQLSMETTYK